MAKTILDKLADRAKVRVYKPFAGSDDRKALCGEKMQKETVDGEEKHFFEVPAHQGDDINRMFKQYTVTEPYIPGMDDPGKVAAQPKPDEEDAGKK